MAYKPILFNTEMVQAILAGSKTQTRRVAKQLCSLDPRGDGLLPENFKFWVSPCNSVVYWEDLERQVTVDGKLVFTPCWRNDILWVRETWQHVFTFDDNDQAVEGTGRYIYFADNPMPFDYWVDADTGIHKEQMPWKPSIHMPKEAARIFLRVKDVRVERLQDISVLDAINEGCCGTICDHPDASPTLGCTDCLNTGWLEPPDAEFAQLWDSTIKPADREWYGWDANPWVWVITFERCPKPEGWV